MNRKIQFFQDKLNLVEEHFQVVTNNRSLNLGIESVEGIFVINTPTFAMFNNEFRIYTIKAFKEVLTNTYKDPEYTFIIDSEEHKSLLSVNYPYFRKPNYFVFNPEE